MNYRNLGSTGLNVSEIGFGTWGIGGGSYGLADDQESKKALRTAFDKGVTFYDTADLYGDGHAEELLGEVFSGSERDKIIIATKGGTLPHTTFTMPQNFSVMHVTNALEASLRRLKTDYIDVYLLHSPRLDDIRSSRTLLDTLKMFKKNGRIKTFGISARTPKDAVIAIDEFGFPIVEINFNMIDHRALDNGLFERAQKENIGIIVRTPLTFGYLTGKLKGNEDFEKSDHRNNWPKEQLKRWAKAPELFSFLFENIDQTPAQAALRFCLAFDSVSTVIPGMMRVSEVLENTRASEMSLLTQDQVRRIRDIYKSNEDIFYDRIFQKVKPNGNN